MRFSRRLFLAISLFLCGISAIDAMQTMDFNIKQTAPLSALPSNEVRYLYFDKKGLLWIATNTGLSSYDGYRIHTYRTSEFSPRVLPNNTSLCIDEDNNNNLWIGTQNGLARMNMQTGTFKRYALRKTGQRIIYTLLVTNDGTVWIGTDGGLSRYVPESDSFYTYDSSNTWFKDVSGKKYRATTYNVKSIVQDKNGDIIFGTWNSGLFRFNPQSNTFLRYPKINERNSAHSLFMDKYHRLWIGTWECGLSCMSNPGNLKNPGLYTYRSSAAPNSILTNIIYSIAYEGNTNTLWIGNQGGLSVMDLSHPEAGFCNYYNGSASHPLLSNEINSVTTNGEGIVWIGSLTGGVMQTDTRPSLFEEFDLSSFRSFARANTIRSMFSKNGKDFLFGVGAYGLASYNIENRKSSFCNNISGFGNLKENDLNATINTIRQMSNGDIWIGTYGKGIVIHGKDGRNKILTTDHCAYLRDDCVLSFAGDNKSNVLVGQRNGLSAVYANGKGAKIKMTEGNVDFSNSEIISISPDRHNRFWLSTSNNGIIRVDGDIRKPHALKFHRYYIGSGDMNISDFLNCFEDSRGILWAISNSGGLFRYLPQEDVFKSVNKQYHIVGDQVRSINEDKWGNLWMGTNYGLVKLTFGQNGSDIPDVMNFTVNDGLSAATFVPNSTQRCGDKLFFGNFDGVVAFQPTRDFGYRRGKSPRMIISDITINNVSFEETDSALRATVSQQMPSYTKEITIPSSVDNFGIEFALLTYQNLEQCKYSYKLVGYDHDWQYCDASMRTAKYSNLPSGTYTFLVRATDNDCKWYSLPYSVIVKVEPPLYATWWAYLIYIALFIALLYYANRIYRSHLKTKNRLQMAVVFTNIAHELLTPLTVISASIDHLRSLAPQFAADYTMMQNNIQRQVRLLQQILETRKSQAGELKLLVSEGDLSTFVYKIGQSLQPLMMKHHLTFTIECQPENLKAWFDPDKMDKILYNLLSNAAKYTADNGKVKLRLTVDKNHEKVIITVKDNGCGISKEGQEHLFERYYDGDYRRFKTMGTGIGLALTHDLVELSNGSIRCESMKDKGTTFTVVIPIDKKFFTPQQIDEENKVIIEDIQDEAKTIIPGTDSPQTERTTSGNEEDSYQILLVEDNEELLSLMKQLLITKYKIYTATNGKEALDIISKKDVDLVVSDVMMPVMDGTELTKTIKSNPDYCHLPVILLTAKAREEDRVEALQIGADEFVPKPFRLNDLELRINNLIENRKRIKRDFKKQFAIEVREDKISDPDEDFIKRAVECINAHLEDSEYDREQFARDMGASTSTLYNKLRSLTGMNTSGFIRNIRLKAACHIAQQNPKIHVSDLAYRVGFKDPKYFGTCFKKEFGIILSEYLNKEKNTK